MTFVQTQLPRPRLVASGGPVAHALRIMQADSPHLERQRLSRLREAISQRIVADLELLDAVDRATAGLVAEAL